MTLPRKSLLARGWQRLFARRTSVPPEIRRAQELVAAIDAGGMPLHPARINALARDLGLEVSKRAPVEETIARIRAALRRHAQ